MASQQGAYLGRLFSRGYAMNTMPAPLRKRALVLADGSQGDPEFASDRANIGTLGTVVGTDTQVG